MERFTISLDESLADGFDLLIRSRSYGNRSEAVRDLLRKEIEADRLAREDAPYCIANLSYVFNHHERHLAERLADLQHHAHGLVVSTMHVHLDHDNCLETLFLKGRTIDVRQLADKLAAESGVRHSSLNLVPVSLDDHQKDHWHARPHT